MRSEIGKIALDTVFRERELLNIAIVGEMLIYARQTFINVVSFSDQFGLHFV